MKKKSPRRILLMIMLIDLALILLGAIIFRHQLVIFLHQTSTAFAYHHPSEFTFSIADHFATHPLLQNYIEKKGLVFTKSNTHTIIDSAKQQNQNINYTSLQQNQYTYTRHLPAQTKSIRNNILPESITLIVPPKTGQMRGEVRLLEKKTTEVQRAKIEDFKINTVTPSTPQYVVQGAASQSEWLSFVTKSLNETVPNAFAEVTHEMIILQRFIESNNQDSYIVGEIQARLQNCNRFVRIPISMHLEGTIVLTIPEPYDFITCPSGIESNETTELIICNSCIFAPIDKWAGIPEQFIPPVQSFTYNDRQHEFHVEAIEDMQAMLKAAEVDHNVYVTSAYRSYQTQQETFDYWVAYNKELYGYDQATAIQEANTVSALPGFSEHQLGTAIDLAAVECQQFTNTCQQNLDIWEWLRQNAVTYGFVLTYPEGKEDITGYRYEPWHYRWLGKERAQEFVAQSDAVSAEWLEKKRL